MKEKNKRPVSLLKQVLRIRDKDLRTHAHGACVSIRTRSRNKNVKPGKISGLEHNIYIRCDDALLRYREMIISKKFIDQDECDEITQTIGRLFKRSLLHTFRDERVQQSLAAIVTSFEVVAMINVNDLPD